MGRKLGGLCARFWGILVPIEHNVGWTEAHLHAKYHLDPSSRLATIDTGGKFGGSAPFLERGELGPQSPSTTKSPGPRPTSIPSGILIHPAIWPQQIWTKNWGCVPLEEGELGPQPKQCGQGRGLLASQVSSRSIQPFGRNTPTSQTGQTDNGLIA